MTIFSNLIKRNSALQLAQHAASRDSEYLGGMDFVSFANPTEMIVSRWWPGYRVTDLLGSSADEAIAILLGDSMKTQSDLEEFRRLMATPGIAADIVTTLFPRAAVILKSRNYMISEDKIAEVVKDALSARGVGAGFAARASYTHAITRVLASKGLVAPGAERRLVKVADSFAVSASDLKRVMMIEAMRGVFSESRISEVVRFLEADATPQVIGDKVGEMFRHFSMSIPEIALQLEQFDMAIAMIKMFNLDPQSVPNTLKAHPALISLASIANFMIYSTEEATTTFTLPAVASQDIKEACNAVLTVIKSAPSIESMPVGKFADYFGEVPASSPDGIRRGLVMYSVRGQTSRMDVADVVEKAEGYNMALVDPTYIKAAGIAAPLNGTLVTPAAMSGLANIVADEMALQPIELDDDRMFDPQLLTIQVSNSDLQYLALARARSVAYIRSTESADASNNVRLLYSCNVEEQWRMSVLAATSSLSYFLDPVSVLLYTSKMVSKEPAAFPSRVQSIGVEMMKDIHYVGADVEKALNRDVEKPFKLNVPITPYGAEAINLALEINVLGSLVGYDGVAIDRGTAFYAAIKEPGVDEEVNLMLSIAAAYASLQASDIQGDKAKSWLVVHLAPLMLHPAVRIIAERAVTRAIIASKLDGRRLAPQMREVYNRAFFGAVLVILNRFGKVEGDVVTTLTSAIPTSTLSLQAALTLAQIPAAINGTASVRG